jgi:hypothetical protein
MEIADRRSGSSSPSIRKSLRAHKQSPEYRQMLEQIVQRRETNAMTSFERRRLRLDRVVAGLEIEKLKRGDPLSEFTGIMSLHDPLRGLIAEVEE